MLITSVNGVLNPVGIFRQDATIDSLIKYYTVKDKSQMYQGNSPVTYEKKIKLFYKEPRKEYYAFPPGLALANKKPNTREGVVYNGHKLWPEQNWILNQVKAGANTGLIYMTTASGKTTVIANLLASYGIPTVILCHNIKTTEQMYGDLSKTIEGQPVGLFYGKNTKRTKNLQYITVTTHDTFADNYDTFRIHCQSYGLPYVLLYDECDVNLSKNMIHAISLFGCDSIFGFTGTPYRQDLDTDDMTKIFGRVLQAPPEVLKEQGKETGYYFTPIFKKLKYTSKILYSAGIDWQKLRGEMINDTRILTQLSMAEQIHKERKYILLLTERIDEANMYYSYLQSLYPNINSYIMTGETNESSDMKSLCEMRSKDKWILIGTAQKMYRGVDIPEIDTVCLFFANTFSGFVVQSVGRALRKSPDKTNVHIYDWRDHIPFMKHTLNTQSTKRNHAYKTEYGKNIQIDVLDVNQILGLKI